MSEGDLPLIAKHDLLARVRTGLQAERHEAERASPGVVHDVCPHHTDQTLISIADSLDRRVQRLQWLSRPRTALPDWLKKRFPIFRISAVERMTVSVYSLLFANSNDALRETAGGLDQISQALRSLANASGGYDVGEKECLR